MTCMFCEMKASTVDAELAKKLRLEGIFKREMRSIFRRMVMDFRVSVTATGKPQTSAKYKNQWHTALQIQYERVHKAFRGEVATQNGKKTLVFWIGKAALDQQTELANMALLQWRDDMSVRQSQQITDTNDADMSAAVTDATNDLVKKKEPLDRRVIAALAAAFLARRYLSRINTIAQTETQAAAEVTKQTEAEVIAGVMPSPLRGIEPNMPTFVDNAPPQQQRKITKTWVTVGDSRVRASHVAVNGTTIGNDEVFTLITGSKLRFPGDMLLGANIKDLINCRCSARYEG